MPRSDRFVAMVRLHRLRDGIEAAGRRSRRTPYLLTKSSKSQEPLATTMRYDQLIGASAQHSVEHPAAEIRDN
jgi:hypothetical protein